MSTFLKNNWGVLIGLGAGIAIGAWATLTLERLTNSLDSKLARLVNTIERLQQEIHELNAKIREVEKTSFGKQKATSSVISTDEDEDEFVEAVDQSEFERLRAWSRTNAEQSRTQTLEDEPIGAENREEFFAEVDTLMEGTDDDKRKALDMLSKRRHKYSDEAEFLWRYSKSNFQNAGIQRALGSEEKRKELVFKSVDIIREALVRGENIAQVHKWYAITLGSLGDFLGTQEKIKNGYTFKEHIEKAISLDPKDSSNFYLLGRWCYGVYMLTWVERKVAATLFATPPSSDVDEALQNFLKANEMAQRPWKENSLFVAKCYVEKKDYASAAEWLYKASEIPSKSQDEKVAHEEVLSLIAKYGQYATQ